MSIHIQNLSKQYQPPRPWWRPSPTAVAAVQNISLHIQSGERFGLLGPNGAGKTTLVKMLCTLIQPSSGTAVVANHPLTHPAAIRTAVGLVISDERSFYWRLTARQNLTFFAALHNLHGPQSQKRVETVLDQLQLTAVADQRFSHFSSGLRQRLAIARALLHQPRILFLDEPSRSLDPTATDTLHQLLLNLQQQQPLTLFWITHDLAEAEKMCQRVALMHRGQIRVVGQPAELRQTLRPYRHYQLHTSPIPTAVADGLAAWPVTVGPQQVQFEANETDGLLTAVLDHLRHHQIIIHSINSHPPTLDELFAHYTQPDQEPS